MQHQQQETKSKVWRTSDNREINISDMDDDHLMRAWHRSTNKKEELERKKKKIENDLSLFSELNQSLYLEIKHRNLALKLFMQDNRKQNPKDVSDSREE